MAKDQRTVELHAVAGPAADLATVNTILAGASVTHGIDADAVRAFAERLHDPAFAGSCVAARATLPVPGRDGSLELCFLPGLLPGQRIAHDAIDYRERSFLHPAAEGERIAIVHAAVAGTPGRDCLGRAIAAPPVRELTLRAGAGVRRDADGTITSVRDGCVTWTRDAIDVVPLFVLKGDVNLRTGNLRTHGSLQVAGDVTEGFAVEVENDVDVQGGTFGGAITAGGNVRIALGAQQGSRVDAGGDIRCRHATASTLSAAGAVVALDELVRCDVTADRIEVAQGRGHVLGGTLRARTTIEAIQAGAESGTPTLLSAADLASERAEVARRTTALERAERQAQKAAPRASGPARGGKFGREQTAAQDAELREKVELGKRQRELLPSASITIRGAIHPGVRIRIGTAECAVDATTRFVRYRWDCANGAIVMEPT